MPTVDLKTEQWNAIVNILASAPWRDANPLLMEIGRQLQLQAQEKPAPTLPLTGNGQEARHE